MRQRPFLQLDVFSSTVYRGNPLAVVLDGEDLDDATMLAFARWTNLSETTFVLPPTAQGRAQGADYRLRIFTPAGELAFAGHPTLGSCHAWLAHGGQPQRADRIVQECAKGLVPVARQGDGLAFSAPPLTRSAVSPTLRTQVLQALALPADALRAAQWLDNGSRWMGLLLDTPARLADARPNGAALHALGVKAGLCAIDGTPPALEVRALTLTADGITEDPATGSLNASLAQWLQAEGYITLPYTAHQGRHIGRAGVLRPYREADGALWLQGQVHIAIQGQVCL